MLDVFTKIIMFIDAQYVLSEAENSNTGTGNTIIELLTFTFRSFLKLLYPIILYSFLDTAVLSYP